MTKTKTFGLRLALQRLDHRQRLRRNGRKALKTLELIQSNCQKSLTAKQRSQCDEYAGDVFGDPLYAPWLYINTAFNAEFREGWIPDSYYGRVVVPRIKGRYGNATSRRALTRILFDSDAVPDLGYVVNGRFYDLDRSMCSSNDLARKLFADADNVVFKHDRSRRGRGVFFWDRATFDRETSGVLPDGVFQRFVPQHDVFSQFGSAAVATVRMTTVITPEGKASLRSSNLRLGMAADTHILYSSLCLAIDPSNGAFGSLAFTDDWAPVDHHPESKIVFEGLRVPSFDACRDTVLSMHGHMPFSQCIGWDLTVDADGKVQVLELNGGHNGIQFGEMTQGPCFKGLGWESLWKSPLPDMA